jgi:hypothetical protein
MKRAITVLLSLIFLFNCTGYNLIFFSLQNKMHRENWNNHSVENSFIVSKGNKVILINEHELLVNGKVCDIICCEKTDEGTKYVCREDAKENELLALFAKTSEDKKDSCSSIKSFTAKTIVEFIMPSQLTVKNTLSISSYLIFIPGRSMAYCSSPPFSPPEA